MHEEEDQPVLRCEQCNKPFDMCLHQSTLKRHGYYCRSRRSKARVTRSRSCLACAKGKSRCDNQLPKCSRCGTKNIDCRYPTKVTRDDRLAYHDTGGLPEANTQQKTVSASASHSSRARTYQPTYSDNSVGLDDVDNISSLDYVDVEDQNFGWAVSTIDFTEYLNFNEQPVLSPPSGSSPFPSTRDTRSLVGHRGGAQQAISIPRLPTYTLRSLMQRPKVNAGAQVTATLIRRIFSSYPMMMLRYNTLPPFIHPQWISSPGEKNYLEPLTNCMSLVHMISAGLSGSSKLFWRNVRQECDRLCEEHTTFDKWQLLAATQALLMYMLMRLAEGETEHNDFDIPLLSAMMIMLGSLRSRLVCQASGFMDHGASWKDWIFEESRRRLGVLLRIINMIVCVEPTTMCHMKSGLVLAPLPARKQLWEASDEEKWTLECSRDVGNKSDFGLTDDGELVKLDLYLEKSDETPCPEQLESAKFSPRSSTNWEEWCSGMDGFGALVMLAASLPR